MMGGVLVVCWWCAGDGGGGGCASSTHTTNSQTRPPLGYPAQGPHDNYTASCDIPSTTRQFHRRISGEAPSNRSSAKEYNKSNSR